MTDKDTEFAGIPATDVEPRGSDPNYGDGYQGMRMSAESGQAAYGAHRLIHHRDLETAGGFGGIHGSDNLPDANTIIPAEEKTGGVRPFGDPEMMRDFDTRGERFATDRFATSAEAGDPSALSNDSGEADTGGGEPPVDGDDTNRGLPAAGFSESWTRRPGRS